MENMLLKYMQTRFEEKERSGLQGSPPFVTFSREFGCPSKIIAQLLIGELNKRRGHEPSPKWKCINKEIVLKSAMELDLEPDRLKYIFDAEEKGTLDDVLFSFSSNYKSNQRIIKTIKLVIKSFTSQGYVVLIGRGGVAITYDCPNSLHIRLHAPLDWRTREIAQRRNLSEAEACKMVVETDKKRAALIEQFLGKKLTDSIFDAVFNCKTLSPENITQTIVRMMEVKKMI
jgi:cytidylate kinase